MAKQFTASSKDSVLIPKCVQTVLWLKNSLSKMLDTRHTKMIKSVHFKNTDAQSSSIQNCVPFQYDIS